MIQREGGTIHFVCDACPEDLDTGCADFAEANERRFAIGWKTEKLGQEWLHLCPDCRGRG